MREGPPALSFFAGSKRLPVVGKAERKGFRSISGLIARNRVICRRPATWADGEAETMGVKIGFEWNGGFI